MPDDSAVSAGAAIKDWRSQLRAALALGGDIGQLTDAERGCIDKGRSFEAIFAGAKKVQLPWRLPSARCDIAYVEGDPNPWCRCTATIPASTEAVLEGIWEIDSQSMRYHERVRFMVSDRPSGHTVKWTFIVRVVPMKVDFHRPSGADESGLSSSEWCR